MTLETSPNAGFFRLDGVDYKKGIFTLIYNKFEGETVISLANIYTGNKIISSKRPTEISGIENIEGLLSLLLTLEVLASQDTGIQNGLTPDLIDYFLRNDVRQLSFSDTQNVDSRILNVVASTSVLVGNYIRIQEGDRLFQAKILAVGVGTITIDTPLDFAYTPAANFAECSVNLAVDGSATPQIFSLEPRFAARWKIARIIIIMSHTSAGDGSRFGDLAALANGIVIRKTGDINHTIFNAKTNGDLKARAYDLEFSDKAGGGNFSTTMRKTFTRSGAVVELDFNKNESFEIVVQDDLTGLISFNCVLQGYVEI